MSILTIYFSGTGNTAFVAKEFARRMGGKCLSIEDDADFVAEIAASDTIAICYPIYGSRVPLIMRRFAAKHTAELAGKKLVILVTQLLFSGDGARVFTDMFPPGHFDVIYAEHIILPNNVNNFPILRPTSKKSAAKQKLYAKSVIERVCGDIGAGIVRRRGFTDFARFLGSVQGVMWQGKNSNIEPSKLSMEHTGKSSVKISESCTACGLCAKKCPMKNLEVWDNTLVHKNNCTICYRCVNLCPHKAITVFFSFKPKWQYKGL